MELKKARNAVNKLNAEGHEARLYEGYSGRGMFGGMTTGVVVRYAEGAFGVCPGLKKCRRDNLGFDTILY